MVGLPARGKTYIAQKLRRYLSWIGYNSAVFNVGNYRRQQVGPDVIHSFFDPENQEGQFLRKKAAESALNALISWLTLSKNTIDVDIQQRGSISPSQSVAIYDATNSTKSRRRWIVDMLLLSQTVDSPSQILFIETICSKKSVIDLNITQVKLSSPDYKDYEDPEKARLDFVQRIKHYSDVYETLSKSEFEYSNPPPMIKLINVGDQLILLNCTSFWQTQIASYLMNLHISPRFIYLCRHGESEFNVAGKIGGDSDLSENGKNFAHILPIWIKNHFDIKKNLNVWTSTMRRTTQTAEFLPYSKLAWKALDEINSGICDGMTYEEIESNFKSDFEARANDKFYYRYPNGESYSDLITRLEPIMMELERQTNILIIGHQAVLRAIIAYMTGVDRASLPYIKIPLHVIIEMRPLAYGCEVIHHRIPDIPAVDTHHTKQLY